MHCESCKHHIILVTSLEKVQEKRIVMPEDYNDSGFVFGEVWLSTVEQQTHA